VRVPAISVVLPVFNSVRTLWRAVESIRGQTFRDWELILVNDGSTDGTDTLINSLSSADARIRGIHQTRTGIVAALNRGLDQVRAPLIARMDADDESAPERLEAQLSFLWERADVGLVSSLVQFGGDETLASGYALHVAWMNSLVEPETIALNRFIESPIAHPSVMFRRELVDKHGGYLQGSFPEDYELWLRWMGSGVRMAKVRRHLLTWHDLPGRLSRQDSRYSAEAFYRCKAVYLFRWLQARLADGRPVLVWGAGRRTRRRVEYLIEQGLRVAGYVDIDPRKIGREISGRPVLSPESVPAPWDCFVVGYVGKRGARALARAHLGSRGYVEGEDFIMAA
jgi:glycosyltransferase involved in cell wall biosynthesis